MVIPQPLVPDSHSGMSAMSSHPPSSPQPIQPWKPPQALQRLGDAPTPPPLPFRQGVITSSTIPPVQVLDCPKESDTQPGRIGSMPLNCQQSPMRSISMLQSSLQEQSSIYCQEAPLQFGPSPCWSHQKAEPLDYQHVAQLDCLNKVVSLSNGAGNKVGAGEARRSPPTPWKPPAEMKTSNAGFSGSPYSELLDQGPVPEDYRTVSRDQSVMGGMDNSLHSETVQQKTAYFVNGDGAGQSVQSVGTGQARNMQGPYLSNNSERPLHGLMLSLSSSAQANADLIHDNGFFPGMSEPASIQRDKAVWASAMSMSPSQWDPETTAEHCAFLNNLATQIERNQQLSNGRLSNAPSPFPSEFVQERNSSVENSADRSLVARSYVPQGPAPPAPQFVHPIAPKESFSSQLNRLAGYQTNFNAPVFGSYGPQFPRYLAATGRPVLSSYNGHLSYNGLQDWERLQSVGSFTGSRNFNNLGQPQDSQQFGKFDVNGLPSMKYKPANDQLNWSRAQDSGLGSESFLDVANQQSNSLEFSRDYMGPRVSALNPDQLVSVSGRAVGERLINRGEGMVPKQQYWMGADRNGWNARSNGEMGGLRSNSDNFGPQCSGIPERKMDMVRHPNQASVVPDNHVRDRGSILGTGGMLFNESYQNQSLGLIHHGRDAVLNSYDPSESEVASSFPISSNSTEMMSVRSHPDGSVRNEKSLVATEQGGSYAGNLQHQVMKSRVNPETSDTRERFQEGEPAPSTPEKSDIVDGMELKCPHGDFGPSKQGMHDATIVSLSEITCPKVVQPSAAGASAMGRTPNGLISEQTVLCSLDSPAAAHHMKPPPQTTEHAMMSKSGQTHGRAEVFDTGGGASPPNKRRKVAENGSAFEAPESGPKAAVGLDMLVDAVQVASGSMQEKDMSPTEFDNVAQSDSAAPLREAYPLHEGVHVVRKKILRRARSIFKRQSSFGAESNGSTNEVGPGELFNGHGSILGGCREVERDTERSADTDLSPGSKDGEAAPVIRTKRGRAQMLPSRLRDSVLEPLKKGAVKSFKRDTSEDRDSGSGLFENLQKRLKEGSEDRGAPGPFDVKEEYGTYIGREDSAQGNYEEWSPKLTKESEGLIRGSAVLKHKSSPHSDVEVTWDSAGRTCSAAGANSGLHPLEEFDVGDIVWAKSGKKNDPVWPAKVVDPIKEVPDTVRSLCVPGRLCVMFFGKSLAKKKERDYAWVRQGMIFPFMDYLDRFQGQTNFNRYRPIDFVVAINEATLADAGFDECQGVSGKCHPSVALAEAEKQPENSQDTEDVVSDGEKDIKKPSSKKPVSTVNPLKNTCAGCGAKLSVKATPKPKNGAVEDNPLCRHCVKLYKSRQYCGVCKKVWQPNEKGNWVQCDACNIWVHADCDKISNKSLKELEKGSYKCPECRKLQTPRKKCLTGRAGVEGSAYDVPDSVAVVCAEMQADYLPKLHQISCTCKQCGHAGKIMKPSEWERHTGCRKKKWKESIRMRYLEQTLLSWIQRLMQGGAIGLAYAGPEIRVPPKMRAQQLAACLDLPYDPVRATFTTERCGVCRWVEDYDYNKMIICNRCQIAVHEECYGVQYSDKAGPWVCRACETPDVERECCLCPVKGGAMKPTSVSGFWVHVTCAWFIREVTFKSAAKMEPAEGVTNIDLGLFRQTCVVCRQVHGAVIQCCGSKCRKVYHTMCAFNAGYYMEINSYNDRNGVGVTKMITYCATHRTPDPEGRLHLSSPEGKIAEKRDYLYPRGGSSVVSILSGNNLTHKLDAKFETTQGESSSAARCRPYDKDKHKHKKRGEAIAYRVTGISWHSAEAINALRDYPEPGSTINERLASLPDMEKNRVCFGKSAIHGWGLFARRSIKEGEMVLEYRGDRVRGSVADLREEHYRVQGKDCYLFKVNEEEVIDATDKGNLGRLINHSCEPSCYSKIFEETNERGDIRSRVVLMARKDVKAGEELTYDYRFDPEDKKVECLCGAANCRQFMN